MCAIAEAAARPGLGGRQRLGNGNGNTAANTEVKRRSAFGLPEEAAQNQ